MRDEMSLYAKYLTERTYDSILERPEGFVTYRYIDNTKSVYIMDIYIDPEFRTKGAASKLADVIADQARAKGYKEMLGTVVPSTKNSTASLKVLLGYGMELKNAGPDLIVFRKEL